jgi:copper(I)-binding protein
MHRIAFAGLVIIAVAAGGATLTADTFTLGRLTISQPWARATPPGAKAGAAYLIIKNESGQDDRLTAVVTPAAKKAELHTHVMDGNVMKMRPVKDVDVKAGGTTQFAPGGFHVMLLGLNEPLKEGKRFPLTLTFEKAGSVTVEVEVQATGAMGEGQHRKH